MKGIQLIFFFLLAGAMTIQAQDQEALMDQIAEKACECAKDLDMATMSESDIQAKLGMCMMQNMMSMDQEKLKALDLDMTNQTAMTEFGQKVGFKMAAKCPEVMMAMAKNQMENSTATESAPATAKSDAGSTATLSQVSGTVKGIAGKDITFIQVEDASGAISAFMWLDEFEGDDAFKSNPDGLVGKKVRVTYDKINVYSPKAKTYSSRKVIKALIIE